jgi:MoaA/NifB/PqqE/SkfB family radical SAM enzyme
MHGSEVRLNLFRGDALEYRFSAPRWRQTATPIPWDELADAVRAIDPRRCRRLLFGDGPLAHPRFSDLVALAKERGVGPLAVETDAPPLARDGALEALVSSGIEKVFAVVGGGRPRVHEQVMHDPGSFAPSIEGLRRAAASKLELYVVMPALRWNERDVEPFLDWLIEHAKPRGFLLALPEVSRTPDALRKVLLPYGELAALAARVFTACSRAKVEYGFSLRRALPPCAARGAMDRFGTFFFDRMDYLRHADRAEFDRVAACASCSLAETCPGIERDYLAAFGREGFDPVALDVSMDWKLKQVNKLERRDFKNVSDFENDDEDRARSLLRINGHCNMSCSFCFVDRTVPDFEEAQILGEVERMASKSLTHMVFSGGEPTLHPGLARFIARAKELGFRTIEMQSNGVKAADMAYAKTLVDAGLNKVTFSLHSVDPAHSDKITRLPGAFHKTMAAMHNFRRLGVLTQVAHVITRSNYEELPATVRFLRAEFPEREGHLSICFGVAQPISDLVYTWVMPRFDEIKPFMRAALDHCLETEVGFGGMIGQGGYPPCMLDGEMAYYAPNLRNIYRSPDYGDQFVKPPKCRACSFDPYCVGVRRIYVETYGDDEIRPFTADLDALVGDGVQPLPPTASTELSATFAREHDARPTQLVQLRTTRNQRA